MRKSTAVPTLQTHRSRLSILRPLVAWLGIFLSLLGLSALALDYAEAPDPITYVDAVWPVGPADPAIAQTYGRMNSAPLMASPGSSAPETDLPSTASHGG